MMTFSNEQLALIEQTAFKVAETVKTRICDSIEQRIRLHAAECPTKQTVEATLNQLRGGKKTIVAIAAAISAAVPTLIWLAKELIQNHR